MKNRAINNNKGENANDLEKCYKLMGGTAGRTKMPTTTTIHIRGTYIYIDIYRTAGFSVMRACKVNIELEGKWLGGAFERRNGLYRLLTRAVRLFYGIVHANIRVIGGESNEENIR